MQWSSELCTHLSLKRLAKYFIIQNIFSKTCHLLKPSLNFSENIDFFPNLNVYLYILFSFIGKQSLSTV